MIAWNHAVTYTDVVVFVIVILKTLNYLLVFAAQTDHIDRVYTDITQYCGFGIITISWLMSLISMSVSV